MTSYVACPDGMAGCDPAAAPDGTVFTYVRTIYPGEATDATNACMADSSPTPSTGG